MSSLSKTLAARHSICRRRRDIHAFSRLRESHYIMVNSSPSSWPYIKLSGKFFFNRVRSYIYMIYAVSLSRKSRSFRALHQCRKNSPLQCEILMRIIYTGWIILSSMMYTKNKLRMLPGWLTCNFVMNLYYPCWCACVLVVRCICRMLNH